MQEYTLSGDFDFSPTNIQSTKGFCASMRIIVPGINREQHVYIKQRVHEILGLRAHSVPGPWGDGPVPFYEVNFDTEDLSLCKHLIGLLKQGGVELKANGRRYPPDSDHPLFATIAPLVEVPHALNSFETLNAFIGQTISEAYGKFGIPSDVSSGKEPKRPDPGVAETSRCET